MLLISSSIFLFCACISISIVNAAPNGDQDQDQYQDEFSYNDPGTIEADSQELEEDQINSLYQDLPEDGEDRLLRGERLVGSFKGKIQGEFKSPSEFRVTTIANGGQASGEHTLKAGSFKGHLKGTFTPQKRQQRAEIDKDVEGAVIGKWLTGEFVCNSQSNTVSSKTSSSKRELETKGSCASGTIVSDDFEGDFVGSQV